MRWRNEETLATKKVDPSRVNLELCDHMSGETSVKGKPIFQFAHPVLVFKARGLIAVKSIHRLVYLWARGLIWTAVKVIHLSTRTARSDIVRP